MDDNVDLDHAVSAFEKAISDEQLSEQVGARLRKSNVGAALVQLQPAAGDRQVQAGLVSAGVAFSLNKNGPLIFSIRIRPSWIASTLLAISSSLRAAFSGSALGAGER